MFELLILAFIILILAYIVDAVELIWFFVAMILLAFMFDPIGTTQRTGQMAIDLHDTVHQSMEKLK